MTAPSTAFELRLPSDLNLTERTGIDDDGYSINADLLNLNDVSDILLAVKRDEDTPDGACVINMYKYHAEDGKSRRVFRADMSVHVARQELLTLKTYIEFILTLNW